MPDRPPRFTAWLLGRLLAESEREPLLGDLEEEYHARRVAGLAPAAARRWFRTQALRAVRMTLSPTSGHDLPPARIYSMGDFLHEGRYALRQLRRRPLYAAVVIVTIALGIGATSSVLSVANPILFRPLPYPDGDDVVMLWEVEKTGTTSTVGYPTVTDMSSQVPSLSSTAAMSYWAPVLMGRGPAERMSGQSVSATFFQTLGVRMALGRDFLAQEDRPLHNRVAILSHELWQRRFGSDPGIIERSISLGGTDYQVVGVLPRDYESVLSPGAEIWRPLGYNDTLSYACRTCRHLRAVARVRSGAPLEQAQTELDLLARRLMTDHPTEYAISGIRAEPLRDTVTAEVRPAVRLMLGAAIFVLLIACANVGNLVLARTAERHDELVVRTALGAGRGRLLSQLAVESAVLALAGTGVGLGLAHWGVSAMLALSPANLARQGEIRLDWRVVLATLAVTGLVTLATSLAPLLASRHLGATPGRTRGVTTSRRQRRATSALVVAEVSLAFMLVAGAGLLTRSLGRVLSIAPGFDTGQLLTMEVAAAGARYREDAAVWRMQHELLRIVRATPGVTSASLASQIPLGGNFDRYGVRIRSQPLDNPADSPAADRYAVFDGYLETMGIPLLRGRGLTPVDDSAAAPAVLINETFAQRHWPGRDPIGDFVQMGAPEYPWREIVGVVGDVRHVGLDAEQAPQIYAPSVQWPWAEDVVLVVRTAGQPAAMVAEMRRAIAGLDPDLAVTSVATAEDLVATSTSDRRLVMRLFEAFALVALLLAAAGIYGLLSRRVNERRREFGIRSALGATRARILDSVLRDGGRLASLGVAFGLTGALGLTRLIEGLLYGVAPTDPVALAAAAALLGVVATAACGLPALRATRADPVEALRQE